MRAIPSSVSGRKSSGALNRRYRNASAISGASAPFWKASSATWFSHKAVEKGSCGEELSWATKGAAAEANRRNADSKPESVPKYTGRIRQPGSEGEESSNSSAELISGLKAPQ